MLHIKKKEQKHFFHEVPLEITMPDKKSKCKTDTEQKGWLHNSGVINNRNYQSKPHKT